jgi:predicted transposase YdaD
VAKGGGKKPTYEKKPQKYDTSFKKWISQQVHDILPVLVTGVEYEEEVNVEVSPSMMRADKVFRVRYHGKPYILHIEFQLDADDKLPARLLVYSAALYLRHNVPVMSMVVYPYSVKMAVSPLVIPNSEKDIVIFHFETLPLFETDAEPYVRQHQTCMYPLLPTMRGFHADMALKVVNELAEIYRNDEEKLAERFIWMQLFLERNDTIEPLEKTEISERLHMFDRIWDESPTIQKMREEYRVKGHKEGHKEGLQKGLRKGRQEGLQKGRQEGIVALQHALVGIVRTKYPDLAELAQQQASHFDKPDALNLLIQEVAAAPNADTVRWLLEPRTM